MLLISGALAFSGCREAPTRDAALPVPAAAPEPLRDRLSAQFAEAYRIEPPPSTGTRRYTLTAAPTTVQLFDGQPVKVWAYNGQVPGPILRVRLGETLEVTLDNQLPQPTTIHWHGVRVPNAMDGVPGVTQPPVAPGDKFVYRFTPKDAGTFWFHPHVRGAEQVERGLYGVLIVDDAQPMPYSRDQVWVLDDWKLGADGQIDPRFVTRHDLAHDGRWGQKVTVNGASSEQLIVRPGERVRLRLVNSSNARIYRPDFSQLDAKVIAVDGMYTRAPLRATGFDIAPGNRLDVELTFGPQSAGKTFQVIDRFGRRPRPLASVRVESGPPVVTPTFTAPSNPKVPRWPEASKAPVDVTWVLNARRGGKHGIEWTINDRAWGEHEVTGLESGRWTRLRFQNDSSRLHPMHLHGQFFKVIVRNGKPIDTPYFQDTVLLRRRDTVDVAVVPTDWGKWLMHCHILEHAESGMRTQVDVAPPTPHR